MISRKIREPRGFNLFPGGRRAAISKSHGILEGLRGAINIHLQGILKLQKFRVCTKELHQIWTENLRFAKKSRRVCGFSMVFSIPSGKRLHNYGKSPCYSWVNPLFLWPSSPFSMGKCTLNGHVQVRKLSTLTRPGSV